MKILLTVFVALLCHCTAYCQPDPNDGKSIDNLMAALYEVISGEAGEARNWERFKDLFTPDAKLMPTTKDKEGKISYRSLAPGDYEALFKRINTAFYETELRREMKQYGTIVNVWSTYATRLSKNGETSNRGINSLQLLFDGNRYYIMHITWCAENMGYPLGEL